jgi:hypothetical protein
MSLTSQCVEPSLTPPSAMADVQVPGVLSTGPNARSFGCIGKGLPPITSSTEVVVLHGTVQAFEELSNLAPGMDLRMASTSCNFEQYISAFNHGSEPPTSFGAMKSEVPVSKIQLLFPNLTSWPLTCEVPQWCSQEDEVDRPSTRPIWPPKNRHR